MLSIKVYSLSMTSYVIIKKRYGRKGCSWSLMGVWTSISMPTYFSVMYSYESFSYLEYVKGGSGLVIQLVVAWSCDRVSNHQKQCFNNGVWDHCYCSLLHVLNHGHGHLCTKMHEVMAKMTLPQNMHYTTKLTGFGKWFKSEQWSYSYWH